MGSLTTRKSYGLKGYMLLSHVSGDEWGLEAEASSLPARFSAMKVATYRTKVIGKELLKKKLHSLPLPDEYLDEDKL